MQELFLDSHFWYVLSFLVFAAIILKFGMPALNAMLDTRIKQIKDDLEQAENLRVEAQEMLAQYQRKHRDAVKEAEEILATAKENAEKFKQTAEEELNATMERKEQQLNDKIQRMQQNALNEIQSYAAGLAMEAAQQIIANNINKKVGSALVDKSIENIESNVH